MTLARSRLRRSGGRLSRGDGGSRSIVPVAMLTRAYQRITAVVQGLGSGREIAGATPRLSRGAPKSAGLCYACGRMTAPLHDRLRLCASTLERQFLGKDEI